MSDGQLRGMVTLLTIVEVKKLVGPMDLYDPQVVAQVLTLLVQCLEAELETARSVEGDTKEWQDDNFVGLLTNGTIWKVYKAERGPDKKFIVSVGRRMLVGKTDVGAIIKLLKDLVSLVDSWLGPSYLLSRLCTRVKTRR
jgi:hypothetical protein